METGLIFALLSAICFAAGSTFVRRGVSRTGESYTAVLISAFIGLLIFSIILVFTAEWEKLWSISWKGYALFAGAGLIHFVVGRFLYYRSLQFIGANKASSLAKTSILGSVTLGIILLNEPVTIPLVIGALSITFGVILVSIIEKNDSSTAGQIGTSKIQVKGVISGLGAGLCWGISGVLIRPAVTEIGSPAVGIFISYVAAFLIIAGLLFRRRQRGQLIQLHRSSLLPLVTAGVFTSTANLLRYIALSYSLVSLVQPLVGIDVLFILLFSFLLNRNIDVFTRKVIAGMVATAAGVLLITY